MRALVDSSSVVSFTGATSSKVPKLADMNPADKSMEELRKEVSVLKLRVKELGDENLDLRDICNKNAGLV